jgi:hypothetical protein
MKQIHPAKTYIKNCWQTQSVTLTLLPLLGLNVHPLGATVNDPAVPALASTLSIALATVSKLGVPSGDA